MIRFDVATPKDLAEACSLLAKNMQKARLIAGGQNLLVQLRNRQIKPQILINIKGLSEMDYIRDDKSTIHLGSLTTHRTVETSKVVEKNLPMLSELEHQLGCIQSRNWGTIGGNLCQASPTSDLSPSLVALEAKCRIVSTRGEKTIPLEDFFVGYQKIALEPDEILTEIEVPKYLPHTGGIHRKEVVRYADPAIASVSVVVRIGEKQIIEYARIVLQAVGVTPIRANEAEKTLIGAKITDKLLDSAAILAAKASQPISDIYGSEEYKREIIRLLTRDNLQESIKRAQ